MSRSSNELQIRFLWQILNHMLNVIAEFLWITVLWAFNPHDLPVAFV